VPEEDLIFGKNRHFFGGIEPSDMKTFTLEWTTGGVKLTYTLPNDTVVNSSTLCSIKGAMIRRKVDDYPKDEFDGTLVVDATESGSFVDSDTTEGGTYYYQAFPYTVKGVYNRGKTNRVAYNAPAAASVTAENNYE